MGQFVSKAMAFVLLAVLVATPMTAQALFSIPASPAQPAGCHHHGSPSQRADYACCKSGHSIPRVQETFRLQFCRAVIAQVMAYLNFRAASPRDAVPPQILTSTGPSTPPPLRI